MGFGSTAGDSARCSRSLSLRIPFRLCSPPAVTRGLIMQKANGRVPRHAPIACGRTISGLFHSASSGSFRLSLAVLVRYRSSASIQPWRVVPPDSDGVPRAPPYLGCPWVRSGFRLRGSHPLRPLFPEGSPILSGTVSGSRDPGAQAPRFGLLRFRSPLLAQCRLISSPAGTEMFHFPAYGPAGLFDSPAGGILLKMPGCPIRKPPDQSLLTAPRSLSQSSASFFACRCQGILRAPVYA